MSALASSLLADAKLHTRVLHDDEDGTLLLMLAAALADVLNAAEYAQPPVGDVLPDDLRFAVIDQVAMLYDHRGGAERPAGLSLAASRIVSRYRGVKA